MGGKLILTFLAIIAIMVLACGCTLESGSSPEKATATPTPKATTMSGPTVKPATAKAASALEWYPIAEEAAKAWQGDVVLTKAIGGNIASDGSSLPCDGKAQQWDYEFFSLAAKKMYQVFVVDGAVTLKKESSLNAFDPSWVPDQETLDLYTGLYPASDWKIDSTAAAEKANAVFRDKYSIEPRQISYVLFNGKNMFTKNRQMEWSIAYDPDHYPCTVTIDARTGEVLSTG